VSRQEALFGPDDDRWQGPEDFKACVREWAERIGVEPRRVQIQRIKKKWGSCSAGGTLTFSSELLTEPRSLGEAVIVHELLHLKVPNHGPLFRSLERAYLASFDPEGLVETIRCDQR
jgi:predicted metal-dependent hydrolase